MTYKYNDNSEKLLRLLIFIITSYVLIRYVSGININDCEQTKIVLITSAVFMFVSSYYPNVVIIDDKLKA
jgi:hypothetical protein